MAMFVCLCLFLFPSQPPCRCWPGTWFRRWRVHASRDDQLCDNDQRAEQRQRHASGTSRVTWKDTESVVGTSWFAEIHHLQISQNVEEGRCYQLLVLPNERI